MKINVHDYIRAVSQGRPYVPTREEPTEFYLTLNVEAGSIRIRVHQQGNGLWRWHPCEGFLGFLELRVLAERFQATILSEDANRAAMSSVVSVFGNIR